MPFGISRQPSPFSVGGMADENLAQQLAMYKSPATIRDMKQTYFYVSALADLINIDPMIYRYGLSDGQPIISRALYYGNLGTVRTFNISDKVNELMDIRVPKDKYVIEINLVECGIEADTSSWLEIPDQVARKTGIAPNGAETFVLEPTFIDALRLSEQTTPVIPVPPRDVIVQRLVQANKVTSPQTLHCRIKELSNGEPYNWSVTNSGAYSIDKMHQLLVRHGDINYSNLTLEFGHLAFIGYDNDEIDLMVNNATSNTYKASKINGIGFPNTNNDKNTYRQYKYIDYNSETYNVVPQTNAVDRKNAVYPDYDYPSFYKGEGGIKYGSPYSIPVPTGRNLNQPVNRPPFLHMDGTNAGIDPAGSVTPWNYQGKPLLFNQQVSRLGFRFLIRIIHLF